MPDPAFDRRKKDKANPVVGLLVADLHLCERPPAARAAEPDWFTAMERQLDKLRDLQVEHEVPIVCAGDIFDRWNSSPALINFAIKRLPPVYAVPGQHDLPHHRYEDVHRSAYWTLVETGRVIDLPPGTPVGAGELQLWGFPWGFDVQPCPKPHDLALDVAVVHAYFWTAKSGYAEAPEDRRVKNQRINMEGYGAVVIGDNHTPFHVQGPPDIYGCGGFFRRRAGERDHRPSVGLLRRDGSIERHHLDCSADVFSDNASPATGKDSLDCSAFLDELTRLTDASIDFSTAIRREMERQRVSKPVEKLILESMEKVDNEKGKR